MSACFHCGLPLLDPGRHKAVVLGAERELCCAGCEAVARTIVASGLESYYQTRTALAEKPPEAALVPATKNSALEKASETSLILGRVRCGACLWLIERALARAPGVARADVNYATQRAQVSWDPAKTSLERIVEAVRAVGYDAQPYEAGRQALARRSERRAALWRLFVAGFGAMQVMMYAFPAYVEDGPLDADVAGLMRWAGLLITAPVVLFACRPFFEGAWRELRHGRLGLDTPIALGIAAGFLASAWATLSGAGEVYFDSISMLAFLLLGARFLESAARSGAASELDFLLRITNGKALSVDQVVQLAPGERIPADGVVVQGASSADESLLTGESRPVPKRPGDELVAGSVNLEQPLTMCVVRVGADTRAASIARLAERASAARPRLVEAADRIARVLTWIVVGAAIVAGWHAGSAWIAVAVLVATCPCALALAAPVVLTRAGASLLGRGALVTRSRALETLERVTDVVFDKTGTLTTGRMSVTHLTLLGALGETQCLKIARALEASSRHPIAQAFTTAQAPAPLPEVEALRAVPGEGIEGRIDGCLVRMGTERFCMGLSGQAPQVDSGDEVRAATLVFLREERGWLAAFRLEDELRPDAPSVVQHLQAMGLRVHLMSGDRARSTAAIARELGIERWAGELKPADKLARIRALQDAGGVVAMVGDGLNDAPVLAGADVSFAMGGGADATQLRADVVLSGNSLAAIRSSIEVAKRAMRLVRQNLAWAIAYNAAALPLAAAGWIGPWEAALGMGASSLIVALNALRSVRPDTPWKASTSSFRSPSPSYS